jgi:hypothetical protein
MNAQKTGSYITCIARINDIDQFCRRWPCNGVGSIARVTAQWEVNGDLVDLHHKRVSGLDEYAMACFVDDMKAFAFAALEIPA